MDTVMTTCVGVFDSSLPCRLSRYPVGTHGYSVVSSSRQRSLLAHRVAWVMAHGPIPAGLWVLHRCDNPPCVLTLPLLHDGTHDPREHLWLGTHTDNMRDMVAKGRRHDTHGERATRAKLTSEQVAVIRARVEAGETQASLASEYGIDNSNISRALRSPWYR